MEQAPDRVTCRDRDLAGLPVTCEVSLAGTPVDPQVPYSAPASCPRSRFSRSWPGARHPKRLGDPTQHEMTQRGAAWKQAR